MHIPVTHDYLFLVPVALRLFRMDFFLFYKPVSLTLQHGLPERHRRLSKIEILVSHIGKPLQNISREKSGFDFFTPMRSPTDRYSYFTSYCWKNSWKHTFWKIRFRYSSPWKQARAGRYSVSRSSLQKAS